MKSYSTREYITHTTAEADIPMYKGSVVVVGVGYVGLPLAIQAAAKDYRVIGFDIDKEKVARLTRREASYISDDERALFDRLVNITMTSNESDIWHADVYIMCVPTPVRADHTPDLEPVKSAARIIGKHMPRGALVIIESTVNPGACEEVMLPILEAESGFKPERDFYFAHCPERVNPGDRLWGVHSIPRVLGAYGPKSLERALELYRSILEGEIKTMSSIKEAEAVKMVENAFRDVNIAFVNELAMSFDRVGLDLTNVIEGASTKPFSFMAHMPGCGVGGHCIPVDPYYLIRYGHKNGFTHTFLKAARKINSLMPRYTVSRLSRALRSRGLPLKGATVTLLGLSYKRDISDTRESPALEIERELREKSASVRTFDPYVSHLSSAETLEEALQGADCVVIATDHTQFRELTAEQCKVAGITLIVDGRNCLDKGTFENEGIAYYGIGRT